MKILIDTNFLLATVYAKDKNHQKAREAIRELKGERVIVAPVLSELFYMTLVRVNYTAAISLFNQIISAGFTIVDLTPTDYSRMLEIMQQYRDAEFDFVDVALMAVSERLNISHIFTFDHRDFSIFRPQHCEYLELNPK